MFLPGFLCDLTLALNHLVILKVNITRSALPGVGDLRHNMYGIKNVFQAGCCKDEKDKNRNDQ